MRKAKGEPKADGSEVASQLNEIKTRYQSLYENSIVGIGLATPDGQIIESNEAFADMLGYTLTEIKSLNLGSFYKDPDDRETIRKILACDQHVRNFETILVSKNQEQLNVLLNISMVNIDHKTYFQTSCLNIPERKQSEEKLRMSEEKYRTLFNNSAIAIGIRKTDGSYIEFNESYSSMLGYSTEALKSMKTIDITHPDDVEISIANMKMVAEGRSPMSIYEKRYIHKDGHVIWGSVCIQPLRDIQNNITAILGSVIDITERKKNEQALFESEERFRALHNASFGGIAIHDRGIIIDCNQGLADMTGYAMDELKGMNGLLLIADQTRENVIQMIQAGHEQAYESICVRKDGRKFPIRIESRNIPYRGKKVRVTEFRDITEQKKYEMEIRESDKMKTAFIQNISHEIRTPLNSILGFGEFWMESDLTPVERIKYFKSIQRSSDRLMNTVNDYIDMAMIVSGTMKVNFTDFKLLPSLFDIIDKARYQCLDKHLEFDADFPVEYGDLILRSDVDLLRKIISELLENAMKFTSKGKISIGCQILDNHLLFWVKDTGQGIAADKVQKIFEIFTQEEMAMTRGHEGSGLGLSIARGLTSLLEGVIWVESEKNRGSAFYVKIPYQRHKPEGNPDLKCTENISVFSKPLILVAEDDESNVEYLEVVLKKSGLDFLHAADGKDAVEQCMKNWEITLILMDIKMPVMNGLEATRRIKEFRPDLPVIALTAYAQMGDEQMILAAGCDDYCPKPIRPEVLKKLIKKYTKE